LRPNRSGLTRRTSDPCCTLRSLDTYVPRISLGSFGSFHVGEEFFVLFQSPGDFVEQGLLGDRAFFLELQQLLQRIPFEISNVGLNKG